MLSGKYCLDMKGISFQCQGCIFHSNAAPIQYFCNRRKTQSFKALKQSSLSSDDEQNVDLRQSCDVDTHADC